MSSLSSLRNINHPNHFKMSYVITVHVSNAVTAVSQVFIYSILIYSILLYNSLISEIKWMMMMIDDMQNCWLRYFHYSKYISTTDDDSS